MIDCHEVFDSSRTNGDINIRMLCLEFPEVFIGNDLCGLVDSQCAGGIFVVVVLVEVAKGFGAVNFLGECCLIIVCLT